jgi:hypothetical protein
LDQLQLVELLLVVALVIMALREAPHHLAHFFVVMAAVEVAVVAQVLAAAEAVVLAEHLLEQQAVIQALQAVLVVLHLHHLF